MRWVNVAAADEGMDKKDDAQTTPRGEIGPEPVGEGVDEQGEDGKTHEEKRGAQGWCGWFCSRTVLEKVTVGLDSMVSKMERAAGPLVTANDMATSANGSTIAGLVSAWPSPSVA